MAVDNIENAKTPLEKLKEQQGFDESDLRSSIISLMAAYKRIHERSYRDEVVEGDLRYLEDRIITEIGNLKLLRIKHGADIERASGKKENKESAS